MSALREPWQPKHAEALLGAFPFSEPPSTPPKSSKTYVSLKAFDSRFTLLVLLEEKSWHANKQKQNRNRRAKT